MDIEESPAGMNRQGIFATVFTATFDDTERERSEK